jgi:hypothetical protein
LMAKLYPKHPLILTPHFSNCDLNLDTLEGKCIERRNILYHRNMPIKTYQSMAINNHQFFL